VDRNTVRLIVRTVLVAIVGTLVTEGAAGATDAYPSRPVRLLVGYPPGGPADIIARVLCDHLTTALGAPFYVEAKPGAAGNVAGEILANAPPDGYTLYLVGLGNAAVARDLYGNLSYDPATAYAPITLLVRLPVVLEVNAKLPVTSYAEFIAYAKSGAQLDYGSPGIGTMVHLAGELLKMRAGFKSEHIAYRGTGPFTNAMMQNEVQWSFDVPNAAMTLRQGGFVKLLAVTSATRYPSFPDLPTMQEAGLPGFVATTWFALVAPAATPRPIIDQLSAEVARGFKIPKNAERLRNAGLDPATSTPEETQAIFEAARQTWGGVIRANHIRAE
jgi:tripartite-type tricarboxylate transporter receptor subunit TctC